MCPVYRGRFVGTARKQNVGTRWDHVALPERVASSKRDANQKVTAAGDLKAVERTDFRAVKQADAAAILPWKTMRTAERKISGRSTRNVTEEPAKQPAVKLAGGSPASVAAIALYRSSGDGPLMSSYVPRVPLGHRPTRQGKGKRGDAGGSRGVGGGSGGGAGGGGGGEGGGGGRSDDDSDSVSLFPDSRYIRTITNAQESQKRAQGPSQAFHIRSHVAYHRLLCGCP